ncbi:hypothetical protein PsYK624_145970 [Phanerochaete sordida]|uniref:Uncharacterized protein n=1 Tax=Phanerochaete sordida TaxID=48140 RepID=A0A9P3LKB4_9APHY|nr:hypothetical protein PsYK624_145970 [Phanerochaete sordida]
MAWGISRVVPCRLRFSVLRAAVQRVLETGFPCSRRQTICSSSHAAANEEAVGLQSLQNVRAKIQKCINRSPQASRP